jgi:hypothetical protein
VAKTPFALLMAICVAAGKPFLGHEVAQRKALFLAFEGGVLTEEREARLCAGLGVERAAVPLDFMHVNASIGDRGFLDDLESYMHAHAIGFVAIDTYGSALPGDIEHNSDKFSFWLKQLGKLSDETGALIVVLLHENKSAGATGLRKMSGHNSAPGAIQAAIGLERSSDDRTLIDVYCSREVRKAFPPFRVHFTDAPHADAPTGQALLATRKPAAMDLAERPQNQRAQQEAREKTAAAGRRIWEALADNQAHVVRELVSAGGEGLRPAERALAHLADAKFVERHGPYVSLTTAGRNANASEVRDAIAGTRSAAGKFTRRAV